MSKGVAQPLTINDPQRIDKIFLDGAISFVDHFLVPFPVALGLDTQARSHSLTVLRFVLHQFFKIGKRIVGRRTRFVIMYDGLAAPLQIQGPRVFTVVAVHAQQFPVAAVGRIIVVIAVLMVDRQLVKFLAGKFPSAPGANPRQDLKRLIAVEIASPRPHIVRLGQNVLQFAAIRLGLLR
jgi:hypothetical protein